MALVSNSIYAYTNLSDVQVFIKTDDLTDRGDWSSAVAYVLNDAALYLGAYYICLTANTNTPPSGNISDEWSTLVLIRAGPQPDSEFIVNGTRVIRDYHIAWGTNASNNEVSADDVPYEGNYPNVQSAIDALFATTGTTGITTIAQQGSAYAYSLYIAGTNYTNSAVQTIVEGTIAQNGSNYAFGLFTQGTNFAISSDATVEQHGSQFTTMVRDFGTNYADAKDLIVAQQGSNFAYDLYVAGTNYANSLSQGGVVAQQGSQLAFIVRDQGTNYTDNRFAVEAAARANGDVIVAQQGSNYSFGLYVAGTNFALSLTQGPSGSIVAQNGSQFSVMLRDQGTNYTNSQVTIAVQNGSQFSTILRDQGTTYTNAQVAIEAAARASADLIVEQHGSQLAYILYWAGTGQSGAGIQLADAGTPSDGAGLATARVVNDLPIKRIKGGTNIDIENNGTNVRIGIDNFNTTKTNFLGPSVGQAGPLTYAGTVFMDFGSQAYSTITLTGNLYIIPTGMLPGRGISARLVGDTVDRTIDFAGGVRFIGTRPTSLAANKIAIVSFSSYSNDLSNVVGAYSAET